MLDKRSLNAGTTASGSPPDQPAQRQGLCWPPGHSQ